MNDNIYSTARGRIQAPKASDISPAFQFSVLTCRPNLLAAKTIHADGTEIPFGKAKHYEFKYREIDSLQDFAKALDWLASKPRMFIIRGQLLPGLSGWQRRLLYPRDDSPATIECPQRRWIPLDFDGVSVPRGLGHADRLAEAGEYIRDKMLPGAFAGVRAVASATASTGRTGPGIARLRLFFVLVEAADNDALWRWADNLSRTAPDLCLDPSVMLAMQPIYTARPVWKGCSDPVPIGYRVAVLDGAEDSVVLDLPRGGRVRGRGSGSQTKVVCEDIPDWMLDMAEEDAGRGVVTLDTSSKAWTAIKRAFEVLDGCSTGRRHAALNRAAWELAKLAAEGECPEALARSAFIEAAAGINNSDGRYDAALIQRHIDDAFADSGR